MASKNHQGGLSDNTDESEGKMFEVVNSTRCPVNTVQNYFNMHLNPELEVLIQRPREVTVKFNPQKDQVFL